VQIESPLSPHLRQPRVSRREFLSLLALCASASGADALRAQERQPPTKPDGAADGELTERQFQESLELFPNPERGFYAQRRSDRMERLDTLRAQGISLLLVTLDLRDFKDAPVSAQKLDELQRALDVSRNGGYKIIFRAAYGFTKEDYRADPRELERIVGHIRQIGAVLTQNQDVVCGIQAGMLGPWGEWHNSNHGNPPSLEARRAVLFGWLEAVPAPVTVQVRRPMFIRDLFVTEPGGSQLTPQVAFTGARLARTGWHNDAFLVPPTDVGTYAERGWNRERELEWCSQHGRFTPFGGETVHTDKPLPVAAAIREMELLHATYLNIGYHPRVLQLWRDTDHRGENTFHHIARRLGYRLVARRLACSRAVRNGGTFAFKLTLGNVGLASPHLPRVVEAALLSPDGARPTATLVLPAADVRWWGPEAGEIEVSGELPVPADLPRIPHRFAIRFADSSARLREDSRYAIRLANDGMAFTAAGGWNILASDVRRGWPECFGALRRLNHEGAAFLCAQLAASRSGGVLDCTSRGAFGAAATSAGAENQVHVVRQERLDEISRRHPRGLHSLPVANLARSREHKNLQRPARRLSPQPVEDFMPVHGLHLQVEQHHFGKRKCRAVRVASFAGQILHCGTTILDLHELRIGQLPEGACGEEEVVFVILCDQDRHRTFTSAPARVVCSCGASVVELEVVGRTAAGAGGGFSAAINSSQNSAPRSGTEFTPTVPPILSTAFFTIANPMPVPGKFFFAARSNILKIRA
jgi:hypothetical protein